MIQPVRVMVVSPKPALAEWLGRVLGTERFAVTNTGPGSELVRAVRSRRPQIAVVDRVDERPETAPMEIALLKDRCPEIQVIAVSGQSSERDAALVEQGIFYYLTGPTGEDLPRLIEAAVASSRVRRATGHGAASRRRVDGIERVAPRPVWRTGLDDEGEDPRGDCPSVRMERRTEPGEEVP